MVEKGGTGLLYGSNFSVGVHLFYRVIAAATRLIDRVEDYDVLALEMHHRRKKDSPSGTALSLAQLILENSGKKSKVVTERLDRAIEPDELHVASARGGSLPGVHRVIYDSPADSIEISHSARNRGGFALGAVLAAEWLENRTGLYRIEDFFDEALR
jgi:4-hydroxy-tetrahydrodipicolinate reductase